MSKGDAEERWDDYKDAIKDYKKELKTYSDQYDEYKDYFNYGYGGDYGYGYSDDYGSGSKSGSDDSKSSKRGIDKISSANDVNEQSGTRRRAKTPSWYRFSFYENSQIALESFFW